MPALSLNFVEHMLRNKDRLNRKSNPQDEAGFTDDGFALGCAFLLRVLDLYADFDALHWWEEVEAWLAGKDQQLQQSKRQRQSPHSDEQALQDEQEEWNISYKRNMQLSKEWKLLFFGFQASRIFFRVVDDKDKDKDRDQDQDAKEETEEQEQKQKQEYEEQSEVTTYPTPQGQTNGNEGPPAPDDGLGF